jgi:hypothetical protein
MSFNEWVEARIENALKGLMPDLVASLADPDGLLVQSLVAVIKDTLKLDTKPGSHYDIRDYLKGFFA